MRLRLLLPLALILAGCGAASRQTATAPTQPTNLTAVNSAKGILISWTPATGETSANIFRAGANYPGHAAGTPWGSTTAYSFLNEYSIEKGQHYCYYVSAVTASGETPEAGPVCVLAGEPPVVTTTTTTTLPVITTTTTTAITRTTTTVTTTSKVGPTPTNCFGNEAACGYPSAATTGVQNCAALKPAGTTTITTNGAKLEGVDVKGYVVEDAANIVLNNDCIEGAGGASEAAAVGSGLVVLSAEAAASGALIENTTIRGLNERSESVEGAIRNNTNTLPGFRAVNDRIENCGTCLFYAGTVENSYINNDGLLGLDESFVNHAEDWYFSNSTIVANHDTLLNPSKEAAEVFGAVATGTPCSSYSETITNSLLAGGGYALYICAHSSGNGNKTINITGNRFARKVCTKAEVSDVQGRGGKECSGSPNEATSYFDSGEGSGGFFPQVGFFGVVYPGENGIYAPGVGWSGNYLDDNLAEVPEGSAP